MNNSNFGYDCRNNIDNCKFAHIFDEYKEITFINRYHNIFDERVSKFATSDLLKTQIEEKFNEIKLQTIKTERLSSLEAAKNFTKNKKN